MFILRAETLSDPLWIKKRTILIVIGMKTSILTQFGVGSCRSEKGEVLFFRAPRQEGGEMHRGDVSRSDPEQGTRGDVVTHTGPCAVRLPVSGCLTLLHVQEVFPCW